MKSKLSLSIDKVRRCFKDGQVVQIAPDMNTNAWCVGWEGRPVANARRLRCPSVSRTSPSTSRLQMQPTRDPDAESQGSSAQLAPASPCKIALPCRLSFRGCLRLCWRPPSSHGNYTRNRQVLHGCTVAGRDSMWTFPFERPYCGFWRRAVKSESCSESYSLRQHFAVIGEEDVSQAHRRLEKETMKTRFLVIPILVTASILMFFWNRDIADIATAQGPKSSASPSTDVGGIISSDATWSLSNSPYNLISDVQVSPNVTLTIEPGVVVNGNGLSVQVWGTLNATGLDSSRIVFNNTRITPGTRRRHRLYFLSVFNLPLLMAEVCTEQR